MSIEYNLAFESTLAAAQSTLSPQDFNLAVSRALKKLVDWTAVKVSRHFSAVANIPVRTIKDRVYKHFAVNSQSASLWIGLSRIQAYFLGRVRKNRRGVNVRGHQFDGAFLATMKTGHTRVWQRSSDQSLPIEYVYKSITTDADIEAYLASISREVEQRFAVLIQQQLTFLSGA